jgi:hypothetical protein
MPGRREGHSARRKSAGRVRQSTRQERSLGEGGLEVGQLRDARPHVLAGRAEQAAHTRNGQQEATNEVAPAREQRELRATMINSSTALSESTTEHHCARPQERSRRNPQHNTNAHGHTNEHSQEEQCK